MLLQPKEGAIIEVKGGTSLGNNGIRVKVCSCDKEKVEQCKMEKVTNGLGRASQMRRKKFSRVCSNHGTV